MSTPICSRCQKLYTSGSAPAKCVNCGGDIRIPGAASQSASQSAIKASTLSSDTLAEDNPRTVDRPCHKAGCHVKASHSIKYFIEGKNVVMAPASEVREKKAKDFCIRHAREFVAPDSWTLVHKESIFEGKEGSENPGGVEAAVDGAIGCLGSLIVIILSVAFFAVVAVVGIFIVYMVFEFFVALGSGESNRPIRVPFRWRK